MNPPSPAVPTWASNVNYPAKFQVVYVGFVYISVSSNIGQQPDINPGIWQQVSTPNSGVVVPSTIYLRYIYDVTNVALMDPLFIKFFSLGMAIDLSPKFSVAATAVDRLMKTFTEVDTMARSVNGQDNPPKRIQQSQRLAKRRGYQYNIFAGQNTIFGA